MFSLSFRLEDISIDAQNRTQNDSESHRFGRCGSSFKPSRFRLAQALIVATCLAVPQASMAEDVMYEGSLELTATITGEGFNDGTIHRFDVHVPEDGWILLANRTNRFHRGTRLDFESVDGGQAPKILWQSSRSVFAAVAQGRYQLDLVPEDETRSLDTYRLTSHFLSVSDAAEMTASRSFDIIIDPLQSSCAGSEGFDIIIDPFQETCEPGSPGDIRDIFLEYMCAESNGDASDLFLCAKSVDWGRDIDGTLSGSHKDRDVYRMNVSDRRTLRLELTLDRGQAELYVYDDCGQRLASSIDSDWVRTLVPGDYFIEVRNRPNGGGSHDQDYRVTMSQRR